MNFGQSFRLAIKSLLASKMRALLTMLGIIIGVAAVIVITGLGNGMQNMMNDQFESLGANLVQVQIWGYGDRTSRSIAPADMYALADKYPAYIAGVSPYVSTQAVIRQGTEEFEKSKIYGVSEVFYHSGRNKTMSGESLAEGRFLSYVDVDRYQNVCVIGTYLAEQALRGDALGKVITIRGTPYTVVGVLEEKADSTEGSGDDVVFIPYSNALRLNATATVNIYLFTSTGKDTATAAKGLVERRLYQTFQDRDVYFVVTSVEMMDAMNTMMNTMMIVLVAIAAISL
ncbi:MAG: ABC transporter permease, partial [Clostridiales bacterium]|nr:ABC transporter permease [Clostridiales bacterium]